jgi:L-amino acid N-acyltransferase YncA
LAELRLWYLAETARLEPRLRLQPEARERIAQAVSAWVDHEERVLLVAETAGEEGSPQVVGYASGLFSIWPPIWRAQHVGEVAECFVIPAARGKGAGRALLEGLIGELSRRGADVLRAPVPVKNDGSVALFQAAGFAPHMRVLERPAGTR